jgi:16S rRNA (cytosine1402-N4)-methyltransferase
VLPNVLPSPSPDAHVPVLAREVGALLDVHPGELIVDCTFGAGGHSRVLARDLEGEGQLVAIDRDPTTQPYVDALRATVGTGVQVRPMHGPFASCLRRLIDEGAQAGAVLMDLGMSSMQVDAPARGFSYMHDAPLDMRMDPSDPVAAASLVNEWSERDLAQIFSRYGEERFARQIARAIVQERASTPFASTLQLVATIKRAIPTPSRFGHGHPAKRVFQALRIAVNDELGQLEAGLESALELCAPGGRVAVISFHSLEDRMVKQRFVKSAKGCICPPDLPVCGCGRTPEFRLVTHKAVRPNAEEVAANPRSASARLRVVQREVTA